MDQLFVGLALQEIEPVPSDSGGIWESVVGSSFLEFALRGVTGVLVGVFLLVARRILTELFEPRRAFWKVKPSLRLPDEDVSEWVRSTGRVPLVHVHEGSVFSKFMSRLDGLLMRPSSVKPAFVIRQWQEVSVGMPTGRVAVPRRGGFRVRVWLHPGEHERHLFRSMRAPGFRQTCSLAFCSPDQLGDPGARIQFRVVATAERRLRFGADDEGRYIEME